MYLNFQVKIISLANILYATLPLGSGRAPYLPRRTPPSARGWSLQLRLRDSADHRVSAGRSLSRRSRTDGVLRVSVSFRPVEAGLRGRGLVPRDPGEGMSLWVTSGLSGAAAGPRWRRGPCVPSTSRACPRSRAQTADLRASSFAGRVPRSLLDAFPLGAGMFWNACVCSVFFSYIPRVQTCRFRKQWPPGCSPVPMQRVSSENSS